MSEFVLVIVAGVAWVLLMFYLTHMFDILSDRAIKNIFEGNEHEKNRDARKVDQRR